METTPRLHSASQVIEVDIIGIGAWSDCFADWPALRYGVQTGQWAEAVPLSPGLIPPRERRRAPQSVKMAVEVMSQACAMACVQPSEPAVVFASAMGDMDITDAMCRTLADNPELVSPTRFHNSVHNAPIGYWSIATGSHAPATAVAGHDDSAALGLLEAGVQCAEEGVPVIYVCQEGVAPAPLVAARPSKQALALALLLAPVQAHDRRGQPLGLELVDGAADFPLVPERIPLDFSGNPAGALLPLFVALAGSGEMRPGRRTRWLPISAHTFLRVETQLGGTRW